MVVQKYKRKRGRKPKFSKQFKEHLRIGLTAAVGFVIAYAWREPLFVFVDNFVLRYINQTVELQAGIISAFLITLVGVLIIWVLSKYLK